MDDEQKNGKNNFEKTAPRWKRPWYAYLPGIWFLLLDLIILYFIVRYFVK